MTKNVNLGKYSYFGYGTKFDACSGFSLSSGVRFGKNVVIFGVPNSSSVQADNRKKDIFVLRKGPIDGLDYTAVTALAKYLISSTD